MQIIQELCSQGFRAFFLIMMGSWGFFVGYIIKNFNSIIHEEKKWTRVLCWNAIIIYCYYASVVLMRNLEIINDFGYVSIFATLITLQISKRTTKKSRKKALKISIFIGAICYVFGILQLVCPALIISNDFCMSIVIAAIGVILNIISILGILWDEKK